MTDGFPLLPDYLKEEIKSFYWNVVYNNLDAIFVFTGRERIGKSTLAVLVWLYIDFLRAKWGLAETFDVNRKIAYVPEKYAAMVNSSEDLPGDVVMYDEAGTGMYNRESMSAQNIALNKILMTCGYKSMVHLLNLPNFFALDKEVRARRVVALFHVKTHISAIKYKGDRIIKIEKGWFRFYSAGEVHKIWKDPRTGEVHYPPNNTGDLHFDSLDGSPVWEAYEAHSKPHKKSYIKGVADDLMNSKRKRKGEHKDNAKLLEYGASEDEEVETIEGDAI